jgi:alpha-ribazole phosphatase
MNEIATRLWWIRHAPVDHGGRIYGQLDLSCDCSETAIFTGLAEQLPRAAVWVTSNLRRTHETATAIIRAGLPGPNRIPGPEALAIDDLAEQHFGEWQGLAHEDLHRLRDGDFHRFWHAPAHEAAPGGRELSRRHRGCRGPSISCSRHMPGATSSPSRMAARSVRCWRWRSTSALKRRSPLLSRIASITRIDHIDGAGMGHGWRVVTVNRPPR